MNEITAESLPDLGFDRLQTGGGGDISCGDGYVISVRSGCLGMCQSSFTSLCCGLCGLIEDGAN